MHGHSYRLEVAISGALQSSGPAAGMVEDFDTVREIVHRRILDQIDHRTLNELLPNPTCEHVAAWIWEHLLPAMPALEELVLWETATSCAVLRAAG